MSPLRLARWLGFAGSSLVLFVLYFFGLARTGLLSTDEPRYAAIGLAMARSGDWITPRLWGSPWFEKPPLLYWMSAAGFHLGLGLELAPRLPVALLSVAFLIFFFVRLRREWDYRVAFFAVAILAASAGWVAYSRVAVTDLPLAATFGACMMLLLPAEISLPGWIAAGILLGLAMLAKGFVAPVLLLPAIWFHRRNTKGWFCFMLAAIVVAAPWYALCYLRNGAAFWDDFFWKQHFARFTTSELQHVRPFWFYIPVLLGALFPWTPALALAFRRRLWDDRRARFLAAWFLFGFLFFSAARNKLPGYLLPLLPAAAALLGLSLAKVRRAHWVLGISALLLALIPAIAAALPQALESGLSHAAVQVSWSMLAMMAAVAVFCGWLDHIGKRAVSMSIIAALFTIFIAQ
ncbi:MAG TPA: glycosyltransferase family 39 protein, partial [Bryobacteraceae bacterium]|nr:glycosyltransferase family 39 protein [Bryobacteraceae bacterium]